MEYARDLIFKYKHIGDIYKPIFEGIISEKYYNTIVSTIMEYLKEFMIILMKKILN